MTAAWTAKKEALVRHLNRKITQHDRQSAAGLAVREGKQLLRMPAGRTDRRE